MVSLPAFALRTQFCCRSKFQVIAARTSCVQRHGSTKKIIATNPWLVWTCSALNMLLRIRKPVPNVCTRAWRKYEYLSSFTRRFFLLCTTRIVSRVSRMSQSSGWWLASSSLLVFPKPLPSKRMLPTVSASVQCPHVQNQTFEISLRSKDFAFQIRKMGSNVRKNYPSIFVRRKISRHCLYVQQFLWRYSNKMGEGRTCASSTTWGGVSYVYRWPYMSYTNSY